MTSPVQHLDPTDTAPRELPALWAELPDDLFWLEDRVRALVRPAASLTSNALVQPELGSSFLGGMPDVPMGATSEFLALFVSAMQSPYDGPSHWMQLNLAEIPAVLRANLPAGLPESGVVNMFLDLSGDSWKVLTPFDPRPADTVRWLPRPLHARARALNVEFYDTLPEAGAETLPEIAGEYSLLAEQYDQWVIENYLSSQKLREVQLGGWSWSLQGDRARRQKSFVVGFNVQSFGDSGAAYLHYSQERGFFGIVESC